jgi:SagB-type dehydrogenase family enzyme
MNRAGYFCTGFDLDLLCRLGEWTDPAEIYRLYPAVDPWALGNQIHLLASHGFLIAEGSEAASVDERYASFWKWEATAALYHFGLKDAPYLTQQQATAWMEYRAHTAPPVPLYTTNEGCETIHKFPAPDLKHGLMEIMSRRRSIRSFLPEPIAMEALRDCLFAGLGIVGFLDTHMPEATRKLPLKMTPSGGARNPYEGYAYVLNVEGIPRGLYHYSAIDNSLGLLTDKPAVTLTDLLVGQHWADECGAVILLVANFERPMWKYPSPTAYRVMLIEAGNISQNIALAAANHGLSTTPTAAMNDSLAHRLLNIDWIKQSLVLAVLVGKPAPEAFEVRNFIPHEG